MTLEHVEPPPERVVLFITYLFPPLGGPGVQRVLSFARHLPRLGWRPRIVAVEPGPGHWAHDPSLLSRLPPEVSVRRVPEGWLRGPVQILRRACPPSRRRALDRALLVPDRQIPWLGPALRAALAEVEAEAPRLVFASGGPWTNLLVGALAARRTGLPLVADFRDPWTEGSVFEPFSPLHRRAHRALERFVHRTAARIVANTHENREELRLAFPEVRGRVRVIPNGWDEDDAVALPELPPAPFRVGYAGNFYPGRPVEEVLRLFAAARAARPELEDLELRFAGHTDAGEAARRLGMTEVVDLGYRPLGEALAHLAGCHVTLVTVPAGARRGWVPQKLYQQLRLGRPVLTLAPPGEAADIARAAGQPVVDPRGPEAPRELGDALGALRAGPPPAPSAALLRRYDRRALARELTEVFEEALARPPGRSRA